MSGFSSNSLARRAAFSRPPTATLIELLTAALSAARTAWPVIALNEDRFFIHLAQRVTGGQDPGQCLASMAAGDLYLACACARGNEAAIAALAARYIPEIDHALGRLRASASLVDDVKQHVSQHSFVGAPPGITNYSGNGQLRR